MIVDLLLDEQPESEFISFYPSTELEEILQNVTTILSTIRGSVPLDRAFGISANFLDAPMNIAKTKLIMAITEAVPEQEPRANVLEVIFDGDGQIGKLQVKVKLDITLTN